MKLVILMSLLSLAAAAPALAAPGSWFGYLVDAKCYEAEIRNRNPFDESYTDRDMDYAVDYCVPGAKTKSFAVVPRDWRILELDPAGNAKAAALVQQTGKRPYYEVTVTGQEGLAGIAADSVAVSTAPPLNYDSGAGVPANASN